MTAARTVTFPRVLAAEWTKTTSVGGPLWAALTTVLMAVGVAVGLAMFVREGDGTSGPSLVVSGLVLAQLGAHVLGVLVGTTEHTTGTAAVTFTAVPRRLPVLAAQALLTAGLTLVAAVVSVGASIAATAPQREAAGLGTGLLHVDGAERVLSGFVVHLVAVALLGLGAGVLLRRPAGALVGVATLVIVLDHVLAANPGRVTDTVRTLLPGVGTRLVRDDAQVAALEATNLGPHLGPWGPALVLAAWVTVVLVAATVRLHRTDITR